MITQIFLFCHHRYYLVDGRIGSPKQLNSIRELLAHVQCSQCCIEPSCHKSADLHHETDDTIQNFSIQSSDMPLFEGRMNAHVFDVRLALP